jgi:hypothetical protein
MSSLELINSSVQLAKDLELELNSRPIPPSEEEIKDTIKILNGFLSKTYGKEKSIFLADEAYINIPDTPGSPDIEFFSHHDLMQSKVEDATMRGEIYSFRWLATTAMNAFGFQMYGVDLRVQKPGLQIEQRISARNAFVPVDGVTTPLAA